MDGRRGIAVHRERSWKQCDTAHRFAFRLARSRERARASSKRARPTQKAFHFLPSALFIIALNRRVEKKGAEAEKRNRVCACASLPFRRLPPTLIPRLANPSSPPSLPLLLFPSVRYRRVSRRCITVNGSGNCTLNISGLSPCKHVKKKVRDLAL